MVVKATLDGDNLIVDGKTVPKHVDDGDNSLRESITQHVEVLGVRRIGNSECRGDEFSFEKKPGVCYECTSLTSVTFPEGLQSIGVGAFRFCPLTSVTFPEGLQSIGDRAFQHCPLTSVTFPEGMQSIGDRAFSGCPLTSVVIPDSKISIHRAAFLQCTALEELSAASGHSSILSYLRFPLAVRRRVAVLLCMKRLRAEYYGDDYEAVESRGTTPATGTLEGKLAFQMIASDDLWRYTLEFLGPDEEEDDDEEEDGDEEEEEEDGDDEEEEEDDDEKYDEKDDEKYDDDDDDEARARKRLKS